MKKLLFLCLMLPCLFIACSSDDDKDGKEPNPAITAIELNKLDAAVYVGGEYALKVIHTPAELDAPAYTWVSSDEAVATVKEGKLAALKVGKTTVTVTSGKLTSKLEIEVKDVPVTAVKLDKEKHELFLGESFELKATYEPKEAENVVVQWTSSDEKIATVSAEGKVTTIAVGEAVITAAVGDVEAKCTVSVKAVALTGLKISEATKTLNVGGELELTVTADPANAELPEIVWTTSNSSAATVSQSGVVTAVALGEATIIATAKGLNLEAKCVVTVAPVAVTGITLSQTKISLLENGTAELKHTIAPANASNVEVAVANSDETVATYDAKTGVVTAKKVGTTTITFTTKDGSKTAKCEVSVTDISGLFAVKTKTFTGGAMGGMIEGTDVDIFVTNKSSEDMKNVQYAIRTGHPDNPTTTAFKQIESGLLTGGSELKAHEDKIKGSNIYLVFKFTVGDKEHTVEHEYDPLD